MNLCSSAPVVTAEIYFCSVSPNLQDFVLIGSFDLKRSMDNKQAVHASLGAAPKNQTGMLQ